MMEYKSIKSEGQHSHLWHEVNLEFGPVRSVDFNYVVIRFERGGKEYTEYNEEFIQAMTWHKLKG